MSAVNKFPLSIFTSLLILMSIPAFAVDANTDDTKHLFHPKVSECFVCHNDDAHSLKTMLVSDECRKCHSDEQIENNLRRVAQQSRQEPERSTKTKSDKPGPGMSVPMFYEHSRIGAQPNEMILIPAGEFVMGTNERLSDEGPQHNVTLKAFWIDKYEVTNLQYKKFIDETNRKSPNHFENRTYPQGKEDHPVTYVSWYDAKAYCEWAGKRLPTDEEWEKAARGTDGRTYPWGNEFEITKANTPQRWQALKQDGDTTPVGAFEAGKSPYGLYDMSGNVWEWTASWYLPYPGNKNISENYGETYKTLKGGSWWDCSFYKCGISAPAYNRSFFLRSTKNKSFGFRCAKDADQK